LERSKFIDYKTVYVILFLSGTSFILGLLVFSPLLPFNFWVKLMVGLFLLLIVCVLCNRVLSARLLKVTNELTEFGVSLETKRYRHEIDAATRELQRVNRELKKRVYELHNLFQISLDLTAILDLDQLLNSYLNTLMGQLRVTSAVLFLMDDRNGHTIHLARVKGISEEELEDFQLRTSDSVVRYALQKRRPFVLSQELTSLREIHRLQELHSEVVAPLIHSKRLEGLVMLGPKIDGRAYTEPELEMLTLMANLMAVAITNARLYKRLKDISIRDELTGIFNYRYFKIRLRDEILRARRTDRPLALVILDVDHFKNYNDTLGHPAGDQVLRQIARILHHSVRGSDVVARYGGEEFCIILPEVSEEGALAFGERIRQSIEDFPFYRENVQPGGRVTVSLGAAVFPNDAQIMKELIVKADAALYRAKRLGRNRVCLYGR